MPYAMPAWNLDVPETRSAEALPAVRPLRGLEGTQASLGGLHYVDLVVAEVTGAIASEALARALRALIVRHPVLRQRIAADPAQGFVAVDVGPTFELPIDGAIGAWHEIAERCLNLPFSDTGPSWRLTVARGVDRSHLLLGVHHALVDGRSLSALIEELLVAIDDPTALGGPLAPPPPALQLARLPTWVGWVAPALRHTFAARARWVQRTSPLPARRVAADEAIPTVFAARTLPEDAVQRLRDEARLQDATVSGALIAAAWEATRRLGDRRGLGDLARRASVEAMVDLRPLLPGAPDVGMYAGGVLALSGQQHPSAWGRAAIATRQVHRQVSLGVPLLAHAAFDDLPDAGRWLRDNGVDLDANGGAAAVTQVSNNGPWGGPTQFGAHTLHGVWSATRAVRGGPALLVWLRTVNGVGHLSAIGNGAIVTRAQLDGWLADVTRTLLTLADA